MIKAIILFLVGAALTVVAGTWTINTFKRVAGRV